MRIEEVKINFTTAHTKRANSERVTETELTGG
jgi:hypothetical protein